MEFLNALIKYDKQLLLFLHSKGNTTWDSFWIFITDPIHWTPLFLVLFLVSYKAFGVKKSVLISLFIALGTINSLLIVTIIKNYIKRLRPINDNSINNCIRVLIETRDYSFVSGHSTVSFTIAFLFYFIFNKTHKETFTFGDVIAETEEQVAKNWEQLKLKEGKKSILEGVPKSLPALVKASRIQDKAASAGFDWDRSEQVFEKVQEEIDELHQEVKLADQKRIEAEFGDVLFSLINYARFINVDPESALERTNKKFIKRFQYLETEANKNGESLNDMTLTQMDVYWNQSKEYFK